MGDSPHVGPKAAVDTSQPPFLGVAHAEINDILGKGCGVCIAACPAGAITGRHFTDKQLLAEIEGLLTDAKPPLVAT